MEVNDSEVARILGESDHYRVLGLDRGCSTDDVKQRYRALALLYHPDRCDHPQATAVFQKITESFRALCDPDPPRAPPPPRRRMTLVDALSILVGIPVDLRGPGPHLSLTGVFAMLLLLLLPALAQFRSVSAHFVNPVTADRLRGVLSFSSSAGANCVERRSARYGARYYVPYAWIAQTLGRGGYARRVPDFDRVADELYAEELRISCELEKNRLRGSEGRSCARMRRLLRE